jgi:hypothetical protein
MSYRRGPLWPPFLRTTDGQAEARPAHQLRTSPDQLAELSRRRRAARISASESGTFRGRRPPASQSRLPQFVPLSVTTAGIRTTHGRRGVPPRTPSPLAKHDTNGTEHVSCPAIGHSRSAWPEPYRGRPAVSRRRGHDLRDTTGLRKRQGRLAVTRTIACASPGRGHLLLSPRLPRRGPRPRRCWRSGGAGE